MGGADCQEYGGALTLARRERVAPQEPGEGLASILLALQPLTPARGFAPSPPSPQGECCATSESFAVRPPRLAAFFPV